MESNQKVQALLPLPLAEIQSISQVFLESGLFTGEGGVALKKAQAVVKILAGQELGFSPIYSMQNIDIVKGKVRLNSQVLGALIKRSVRYNYHVTLHDDKECIVVFTQDGKDVYESRYSVVDAQRARLVKPDSAWMTHPKAMLVARALSQGAKIVCPHLIAGADTIEDAGVDEVDGEITKEGEPLPSTWAHFWATVTGRGFTEDNVHAWLGVASVKDWLAQGKTLEQALDVLLSRKALKDIDTIYGTAHTVTLPVGHEVEPGPMPVIVVAKEEIIPAGELKPAHIPPRPPAVNVTEDNSLITEALSNTIIDKAREQGMTQQGIDKLKLTLFPELPKGIKVDKLSMEQGRRLLNCINNLSAEPE